MKLIIRYALAAVLLAGFSVSFVPSASAAEVSATQKKAATKKKPGTRKQSAVASISLAGKNYKGTCYDFSERNVTINFLEGNECTLNFGSGDIKGTYKVTGRKVTVNYKDDGYNEKKTFDILNGGKELYCEEATSHNVFTWELSLVK
ncbi:MAG: hypothetical protein NC201_06115 [Prevotella sp.]|nr:hypothetical protein [Bacteroides sp.]MCM1366805.1 hypothetical protein [Prevotella sp.]MCM1437571.1 hypothetical protein [Prevotella sp.]